MVRNIVCRLGLNTEINVFKVRRFAMGNGTKGNMDIILLDIEMGG